MSFISPSIFNLCAINEQHFIYIYIYVEKKRDKADKGTYKSWINTYLNSSNITKDP